MNENWKLVRNSTCYEVSDLGNVRSYCLVKNTNNTKLQKCIMLVVQQ